MNTHEIVTNSSAVISFAYVLQWVLEVFGVIIIGFIMKFLSKLAKDNGIKMSKDMTFAAYNLIKVGCNLAEKWAKEQTEKPHSKDKLQKAIEIAISMANDTGIANYLKEHGEKLVESYLHDIDYFNKKK